MKAVQLITKAIDLDTHDRHIEALKLYQSGIDELLTQCKDEPDVDKKRRLRSKIEEYMNRAEQIKAMLPPVTERGHIVDKIFIMEGSTGNSYKNIFRKCLSDEVTTVTIEEPYIREHFQLMNVLRFFELIVLKCRKLKTIHLTTSLDPKPNPDQKKGLAMMAENLHTTKNIKLNINFTDAIHDRQIIFDNGFIVKIGRGLHYFKPVTNKYSIGYYDYDLRECKQCNVDIFFCSENKR